jgi:hypothetical protein
MQCLSRIDSSYFLQKIEQFKTREPHDTVIDLKEKDAISTEFVKDVIAK